MAPAQKPPHRPVLVEELVDAVRPALARAGTGGVLVDATCGDAGHTLALLNAVRPERVVLFDRDQEALARARRALQTASCPVDLVHAPFSRMAVHLGRLSIHRVAAVVADLGVSSAQLDRPERGFSFRHEGPLDMRMDPSQGPTAAELIASTDAKSLARILRSCGQEPAAARIAEALVAARPETTRELSDLVLSLSPRRSPPRNGTSSHPATRTFLALRVFLNQELDELDALLATAPELLEPGGRLAVISFQSLEDRRVKRTFGSLARRTPLPRHLPVPERDRPAPRFRVPPGCERGSTPSAAEIAANPRARSGRLRVLERNLS